MGIRKGRVYISLIIIPMDMDTAALCTTMKQKSYPGACGVEKIGKQNARPGSLKRRRHEACERRNFRSLMPRVSVYSGVEIAVKGWNFVDPFFGSRRNLPLWRH
jgi:hypothetical protein